LIEPYKRVNMQVHLREERQRDDCMTAYKELQTLLDREWGIDYACICDSIANDMLTTIEELRSTEQVHLAKLQQDIIAASKKEEAEAVSNLQEHRKQTWNKCLDLTRSLKLLSAQATDLRSRFNENAPAAFAAHLAAPDEAEQAAQDAARAAQVPDEALVDVQCVRVLLEEAGERMVEWHDAASRERERLGRLTEEAAAALGEEHLEGIVEAEPATVANVRAAAQTERWWLEFGWWRGYDVCQQRIHAANAQLLVLLQQLQSTLDFCCEEARAGEARMAGVEEAVTDPHTLLLQV
jgi:hypothetical protein